jgi:uncharacterized protein YebE (UPF0316 family)
MVEKFFVNKVLALVMGFGLGSLFGMTAPKRVALGVGFVLVFGVAVLKMFLKRSVHSIDDGK